MVFDGRISIDIWERGNIVGQGKKRKKAKRKRKHCRDFKTPQRKIRYNARVDHEGMRREDRTKPTTEITYPREATPRE